MIEIIKIIVFKDISIQSKLFICASFISLYRCNQLVDKNNEL
jgi:hypothetical protein